MDAGYIWHPERHAWIRHDEATQGLEEGEESGIGIAIEGKSLVREPYRKPFPHCAVCGDTVGIGAVCGGYAEA